MFVEEQKFKMPSITLIDIGYCCIPQSKKIVFKYNIFIIYWNQMKKKQIIFKFSMDLII